MSQTPQSTAKQAVEQHDTYHTPQHAIKPLSPFRSQTVPGRWDDVDELIYKEADGSNTFRSITRRILFDSNGGQGIQVRYFEVAPGGWSTFEHHQHTHQVIIHRGSGTALVGYEARQVHEGDLVYVESNAWHQFSATNDEPLGFICIVPAERDHPVLPTEQELNRIYSEHPQLRTTIHA